MAFNLYFAGSQTPEVDEYMQQNNVLRLYSQLNEWTYIRRWADAGFSKNLFIDSGAFSVYHSGKTVDIDSYIDKINNNTDIPIWVELDAIPFPVLNYKTSVECAEKSWENYLYMKERVSSEVTLLPLYHFGEPKEHLLRILNTEVNGKLPTYIGVGGRHGVSTEQQRIYFNNIFALVKSSNNPNVRIHAFGMTVLDLLEKFPFYSADSTTWLQLAVNGNICTKTAGPVTVSSRTKHDPKNFANYPKDIKDKIINEVTDAGYSIEELQDNYKKRLVYNIRYFKNWADNYVYKGPETFKSIGLF